MRASVGALAVLAVLSLMAVSFAAGLAAGTRPTVTPGTATPSVQPTPAPTPTPTPAIPTPSPTPTAEPGIRAQAIVVPQLSIELAAPFTAVIEAVFVREGSPVSEGQLLLRLDSRLRQAAVSVADAELRRARAAADRARMLVEQLPDDAIPAQRDAAEADLRLAESEVVVAESAIEAARTALRQTEVRAPFRGTVAVLEVAEGEQAIAGQPVAAVADMTGWLFETTDITELEVVHLAVGDRAVISVTALPDLAVEGIVDQIRVRGAAADGGVRFDVIVRPLQHHEQLRWNMTAVVRILPGN